MAATTIEPVDIEVIRRLYENERLGFREVAVRLGMPPWRVYRLMRQHQIPRRRGSEQNYATYKTKPQFALRLPLAPEEEQLRCAGAMLYRAEGTRTQLTINVSRRKMPWGLIHIRYSDKRLLQLILRWSEEYAQIWAGT